MHVVGIIPVRYNSTRFPGKALALLNGRPMLCHVYEAARSCRLLDDVYVATDSIRIQDISQSFGFPVIMTKRPHLNPTSRVQEVSEQIAADLYVMIGGDEPLVTADDIEQVVNTARWRYSVSTMTVVNAVTTIEDAAECSDVTNIKIIGRKTDRSEVSEMLYASRAPIPSFKDIPSTACQKFVSIGAYTKKALDFFVSAPMGPYELAEEFDLLRFIEQGEKVWLNHIGNHTFSVDTPADLERVKHIKQHS